MSFRFRKCINPPWKRASCARRNCLRGAVAFMCLAGTWGCSYEETSFPFRSQDVVELQAGSCATPRSTREWLADAHRRLEHLLPASRQDALVTDEIIGPDGRPIDIMRHFKKYKSFMHTMIANAVGLSHTAQVTGDSSAVAKAAPAWDGFEDVWIPIDAHLSLSGRIGYATRNGVRRQSDCIILLPGLLGDNIRVRSRDIAQGLREAGFHVIALELRGHGQTEARYPDVSYTFGVLETRDLLAVDEWLRAKPEVRRTGIIGFSWSSNLALLAAWEDGRPDDDPFVCPALAAHMPPRNHERHFEAGIFAVSPSLRFEDINDSLDRKEWHILENPIWASVQGTVNWRAELKGYAPLKGSLRELIRQEFQRSPLASDACQEAGYNYLRLLPYKGKPSGGKLRYARVPVVIIHGANDPLAYADEIGEFLAETPNPMVAAVILPGGGHDGFAAYARSYFYSLMLGFFDPETGAAACMQPAATARQAEGGTISADLLPASAR